MFFQVAADNEAAKEAVSNVQLITDLIEKKTAEFNQATKDLGEAAKNVAVGAVETFDRLLSYSDDLNKTFVGGRVRMQEIGKAINEAIPGVTRLGGGIKDVNKTLSEIAAGTRTQALATSKDVEQLYAASKILGTSVLDIVDSFDKVGISYGNIAGNLTKSITYVQSVGLNARSVMKDVVSNTDALSRFNFEGGVQGLTKMAAQASMLRFDMKKTIDLADSLLDPEKAIEMASGFQRLGVAVGNLGDPLSLLNQALTDPSGLQDSLINMTKQFTYFDEQAKSFKISPQGILTMRELSDATGISAAELRKTALAAAEMDSKLKDINTTGLSFEVSEDNKKLIANVARMDEGGEYEVSIKDERGYEYQRKLTELQEQDFARLIEQQSKAPKTIEEIQSSQLLTSEKMLAEITALKETFITGFFRMPGVMSGVEGVGSVLRDATGVLDKSLENSGFKRAIEQMEKQAEFIRNSGLSEQEQKRQMLDLYETYKKNLPKLAEDVIGEAGVLYKEIPKNTNEQVQKIMDKFTPYIDGIFGVVKGEKKEIGGQVPVLGKPSSDYDFLSTSYNNPALTSIMARTTPGTLAAGNVININSPAISYSPTINPQLQGVNSPQELIDLVNKGGLQLSEQLARSLYESLKKLDLIRQSP